MDLEKNIDIEIEEEVDEYIDGDNDPVEDAELLETILKETCGKSDNASPKASVNIDCMLYDDILDTAKEVSSLSFAEPAIKLERHGEFMQLDFSFSKSMDNNLRSAWSILEQYGQLLDNFDEITSDEVPMLNVVLLPISLKGKYFITLNNPLFWTLQPEMPGSQYNIIRILFIDENVGFIETNEINLEEIKQSIEAENALAQMTLEEEAKRIAEEEVYKENREKMLEEIRKNPRKFE